MTAMSGRYLNVRKDIPIMTDLTALISALEKATGPDREIDARLTCMIKGWAFIRCFRKDTSDFEYASEFPYHLASCSSPYSSSVDAALAFMRAQLPGWDWAISQTGLAFGVFLYPPDFSPSDNPNELAVTVSSNLPLAILLATLRAKQAEMNNAE
jgi:hypothetical protein